MEAVNSTPGIMQVYTTLTNLWKYLHNNPKSRIFERDPVINPFDTCWIAHKRGVKAIKVNYTALVVTRDSNYQNFHAPVTLGLFKALSKFTTIAAIYLLDYTLLLVAKLCRSLQNKAV